MQKRWFVFVFFLMMMVMGSFRSIRGAEKADDLEYIKNARIIKQWMVGEESMELVIYPGEEYGGDMQYQILYEDNIGELVPYGDEWINGWSKPINGSKIVRIEMRNEGRNNERRYVLRARRCAYSGINESKYGSFDQQVELKVISYLMYSIKSEHQETEMVFMGRSHSDRESIPQVKLYGEDGWYSSKLIGEEGIIGKARSEEQENLLRTILESKDSRERVMEKAIRMNGGNTNNTCVYYVSGMLRKSGMKVPYSICNTGSIRWGGGLTEYLRNRGWKYSKDVKGLKPGDICFTTPKGGGEGKPTHSYTFLGWVDENFRYALVCDNQGVGYGGHIHIRNINFATKDKEAFYYYMYKNK